MKTRKTNKPIFLALIIIVILLVIFLVEFSIKRDDSSGYKSLYYQEDQMINKKNKQENIGLEISKKAPNFALNDITGKKVTLWEFYGKKAIILNFWATWCPPCKQEMPLLQKYYGIYKNEIEIIAVNMQEDPALVKNWINDFGITYTVLLDPSEQVKSLYNIYAKPTTYFIDKNGIIRAKKLGQLTEDELSANIREILD